LYRSGYILLEDRVRLCGSDCIPIGSRSRKKVAKTIPVKEFPSWLGDGQRMKTREVRRFCMCRNWMNASTVQVNGYYTAKRIDLATIFLRFVSFVYLYTPVLETRRRYLSTLACTGKTRQHVVRLISSSSIPPWRNNITHLPASVATVDNSSGPPSQYIFFVLRARAIVERSTD